jgi:hypothetical protein
MGFLPPPVPVKEFLLEIIEMGNNNEKDLDGFGTNIFDGRSRTR